MRNIRVPIATLVCGVSLVLIAGTASAADISGTISSTLTITDNSQLVGDVTCTVTGAACITFGAPGITGQADAITGCAGGNVAGESGILVNGIRGAVIQGPGVVQRFRQEGIQISGGSARVLVTLVTASTNCRSGIFVNASSDNDIEANTSVRNGNTANPCGGIWLTGGASRNRLRANRLSGNGYAAQGGNFGIGLSAPATNDNVIVDNVVLGNANGIVLVPGVQGNVIVRNLVLGNPPVQVSVGSPGTAGVDIRNLATPGDNVVEGNVCLTAANAACSKTD
jgi:parallel beta-helix repeat protein